MSESKKVALVISGGGAKGAFAVGVLKYLFENYRNEGWFALSGGTSTGALIAPMAAVMKNPDSMGTKAFKTLVKLYTTVSTPDILKKRNIIELIFCQRSLYKTGPLRKLLQQEFLPEWFDWLQGPEAPHCYVTYVNYRSGKVKHVTPRDEGMTREDFIQAMLASASEPVLMEAVKIGKNVCYDGGVRDLLPFSEAINLGAEKIVPIFLNPEKYPESEDLFKKFKEILLRTLSIMLDETGKNDYKIAQQINIAIQAKEALYKKFADNSEIVGKIQDVLENTDKFKPLFTKRVLDIIDGIRPDRNLTTDSLKFEPEKMKEWVSLGEKKNK